MSNNLYGSKRLTFWDYLLFSSYHCDSWWTVEGWALDVPFGNAQAHDLCHWIFAKSNSLHFVFHHQPHHWIILPVKWLLMELNPKFTSKAHIQHSITGIFHSIDWINSPLDSGKLHWLWWLGHAVISSSICNPYQTIVSVSTTTGSQNLVAAAKCYATKHELTTQQVEDTQCFIQVSFISWLQQLFDLSSVVMNLVPTGYEAICPAVSSA